MIAQGYRHLVTPREYRAAEELLVKAGLSLPEGIDSGLGYYEDGALLGTAFLCGNLICGVCVDPSQRGGGLAAALVGRLVNEGLDNGLHRLCIFTKAEEAEKFAALGFELVAATGEAALLEFGRPLFHEWAAQARADWMLDLTGRFPENSGLPGTPLPSAPNEPASAADTPSATTTRETPPEPGDLPGHTGGKGVGAIVMNANPFTLGHRALVAEAARRCDHLLVFVVEEDASVFPFQLRLRLVREGVADLAANLAKVSVLPGGPYMVTRASFPAYFTGEADHARVSAALDATIFAEKIAPVFGISQRFVGSEPYCAVTSAYNETLLAVLPPHGVRVEIMERAATCAPGLPGQKIMAEEDGGADIHGEWDNAPPNTAPESPEDHGAGATCAAGAQASGPENAKAGSAACEAISASRVRALMREEDYAEHPERFAGLLPPTTLQAVIGPEGREAARKLRERGESRH